MLDIILDLVLAIITWADLGLWGWLFVTLLVLGFVSSLIDTTRWLNKKLN